MMVRPSFIVQLLRWFEVFVEQINVVGGHGRLCDDIAGLGASIDWRRQLIL